jgi:periplasmic mercuric ion binding protein
MKKITSILAMAMMIFFVSPTFAQKSKKETVKIQTSSVCGMCKKTIEKALAYEKGIEKSSLDVKSGVVTVTYNPGKTNVENIRKAINLVGYSADESPADEKAYENLHFCCKKDYEH